MIVEVGAREIMSRSGGIRVVIPRRKCATLKLEKKNADCAKIFYVTLKKVLHKYKKKTSGTS